MYSADGYGNLIGPLYGSEKQIRLIPETNSHGGAEPCPFSPYSDINVRDTSLRAAMNSRLFRELRDGGYLLEDHPGGCTLYERRADVERIMADQA